MPVLENPNLKNHFCRRSGQDRRSGSERRMNLDSTRYSVDRRSVVDRRKGEDRRKHDYWNTNYRYWNTQRYQTKFMYPSDLQSQSDCSKLWTDYVPVTILYEIQSFCSVLIRSDYSYKFPLTSNVLLSYAFAGSIDLCILRQCGPSHKRCIT